jgi:hypothetical protein
MVDLVGQRSADVVCVSATPPAAVMHARYLCKRLRGRLPQVKLVVGLWDATGDLTKAKERIGCGAIVVSTLVDAQAQMRPVTPQPVPRSEKLAHPEGGPTALAAAYPRSSQYVAPEEPMTVDH